jgi:hypothetical protein
MKRIAVIAGAVALVVVIVAAIVPMWVMTADLEFSGFALGMIVLMVLGCFAVGGGLMFLIFYSARMGYDDAVGTSWETTENRRSAPPTE